jgi:hypothetical protein
MTFEETKNIVDEFLNGKEIFSEGERSLFKESVKIIYEDIEALSKTGEFEHNLNTLKGVTNSVVMLSSKVLSSPLGNSFSGFVLAFSELIFNWNNNTYHEEVLLVISKFMTNVIRSRDNMLLAIDNMKIAKDKLDIMRSWSPASYDIAIAYVDEQLKINEETQDQK